jgi:hypothetical protein
LDFELRTFPTESKRPTTAEQVKYFEQRVGTPYSVMELCFGNLHSVTGQDYHSLAYELEKKREKTYPNGLARLENPCVLISTKYSFSW